MVESNWEDTQSLMDEKFHVLEEKIKLAIQRLAEFKDENSRLLAELHTAQQKVDDMQNRLEIAEAKALEADQWKAQNQELTRIKEAIGRKVEHLIQTMDSIPLDSL